MFEDRTYENLMIEAMAKARPGVDTREGSIYFDALAGCCFKLAEFYAGLNSMFELVNLPTAVDEYLDDRGAELVPPIPRRPATPAKYLFSHDISPGQLTPGERFFTNNVYFRVIRESGRLFLEAEEPGSIGNFVLPDTPAIPIRNIAGLAFSTFGLLHVPGVDRETDAHYQKRLQNRLAIPAKNGNRSHYKAWAEEIPGVGRARIIPLWNGDNTVKAVLFGPDGKPAAASVVERVQQYIDPEGAGLGNGVANLGAYFTATAADILAIKVKFSASLVGGMSLSQLQKEASESITEHLKNLALNTPDDEAIVLRVSTVGTLLHGLPSLVDYSGLTLNGQSGNIVVGDTEAPILAEVSVNETI